MNQSDDAAEEPRGILRSSFRLLEGRRAIELPILASANDVREVVQYLKKRPAGVNASEVAQPLKKRIFFPPKVAAYEMLGLVSVMGECLQLSPFGWEFARSLEPEAQSYRRLLDGAAPYRAALQWMLQQNINVVTQEEIATFWQEQSPQPVAALERKTVEGNGVCFFHLCQAAELGTMTIGKRGQPARLRLLREELRKHVEAHAERAGAEEIERATSHPPGESASDNLRVLISSREGAGVVRQIQATLDLRDVASETVGRDGESEWPGGERFIHVTQHCDAAIIVISRADHGQQQHPENGIGGSLWLEIGAAMALYQRRVMLLLENGCPVPLSLQSVHHGRFEGDELTWETGVQLLKVIEDFSGIKWRSRSTA
ncbi:MAG: hypothetical protein ACRD9R_03390 [Pyrinomonadaceae bacterium]